MPPTNTSKPKAIIPIPQNIPPTVANPPSIAYMARNPSVPPITKRSQMDVRIAEDHGIRLDK